MTESVTRAFSAATGAYTVIKTSRYADSTRYGWSDDDADDEEVKKRRDKYKQDKYEEYLKLAETSHLLRQFRDSRSHATTALSYKSDCDRCKAIQTEAQRELDLISVRQFYDRIESYATARQYATCIVEILQARAFIRDRPHLAQEVGTIERDILEIETRVLPLRDEYNARLQRERAEEARRLEEASKRAEGLLLSILSPAQQEEYKRTKTVIQQGSSGTLFRLCLGWAGNVTELDAARQGVRQFCLHPDVKCPEEDNVILQVLMLRTDEEEFRRIANKTALTGTCVLAELDRERRERILRRTQNSPDQSNAA